MRGAEVRFRYRTPADDREAAAAAAECVKRAWVHELGAAYVKVEEVVIATGKARAIEVARASTVGDKLLALWKARGAEPPADRAEKLVSMATELEVAS